jgi:hypothetical protein
MAKIVWETEKDKYEAIGFLARKGVVQNIEANVPDKFIDLKRDLRGGMLVDPIQSERKRVESNIE